jgi:hypothetical protein
MPKREYLRLLNRVVDDIFKAWDGTWKGFAEESGCAYSTVCNLGNYITRKPQLATVLKLAKAAGVKLEFDFRKLQKRRVA